MIASERGSVAAEFAVTLPAVAIVLAFSLGAVVLGQQRILLQHAASAVARSEARGEESGAARAGLREVVPGSSWRVQQRGELVCVEASARGAGAFSAITLTATGCSLEGGR